LFYFLPFSFHKASINLKAQTDTRIIPKSYKHRLDVQIPMSKTGIFAYFFLS
jgi:hypothetical protein